MSRLQPTLFDEHNRSRLCVMNAKTTMKSLIPIEKIERRILWIRNEMVMIDRDLAELYGVQTKVLNQAVRRNKERFPEEFRFQLTKGERDEVVTNCDHLCPFGD